MFVWTCVSRSPGREPGSGIAGSWECSVSHFEGSPHPTDLQSDGAVQHAPPPPNLRGCQFPHLVTMFGLLVLFEPSPQAFVLAFET